MKELEQHEITVKGLIETSSLRLELQAGEGGVTRVIRATEIQVPGLVLAGSLGGLHVDRVQVLGRAEIGYLQELPEEEVGRRVRELCGSGIPCLIVARGLEPPSRLTAVCQELSLPLLRSPLSSTELIQEIRSLLIASLSPKASVHGVLADVFGIGILLAGKSGIGKSEIALDLVMRGHRLVADDIVELRRLARSIYGAGPDIIKHHMEIRGLGILNIKDLFGIAAVRDTKKVELVVELVEWDAEEEYDRLGVDEQAREILGIEIPLVRLPVRPGRNMTAIIEVAARNQLLKLRGHHSAREFQEKLVRAITDSRVISLPGSDVE